MPLQVIITAANTVSRASDGGVGAAGDHQRDDQRHLDDGHRDGEHERAERLAHPVRDDLGVVHGGEHGAGQAGADHHHEHRPGVAAPGHGEDDERDHRNDRRPRDGGRAGPRGHRPRMTQVQAPGACGNAAAAACRPRLSARARDPGS